MQSVVDILEWKNNHPEYPCILKVSYFEIFSEEINDLLKEGSVDLPIVFADLMNGYVIDGLTEYGVETIAEVLEILQYGDSIKQKYTNNRTCTCYGRYQTIYKLSIVMVDKNSDFELTRVSSLNFVHFSGDGCFRKSKDTPELSKEVMTIKSVMSGIVAGAFSAVLTELSDHQRWHIPYRDSKFTKAFQYALGGNSYSCVICSIINTEEHRVESRHVLRMGQVFRQIANRVIVNRCVKTPLLLSTKNSGIAKFSNVR